jgi:hypothetical protein
MTLGARGNDSPCHSLINKLILSARPKFQPGFAVNDMMLASLFLLCTGIIELMFSSANRLRTATSQQNKITRHGLSLSRYLRVPIFSAV